MKNIKQKLIIILIIIIYSLPILGLFQYFHINCKQNSARSWVLIEQKLTPEFYRTKEAERIGKNVLFFQTNFGGWSKDICMQNHISYLDQLLYKKKEKLWVPTIDNDATVTEIDYLSKLYNVTEKRQYKMAVINGVNYILLMQYHNGGFPQKYPIVKNEYQKQITYNDDAMINVMKLLKKINENDEQYKFLDSEMKQRAKIAYDTGLQCILKTQLPDGMWAAQYDRKKLVPCSARKYEPAAIDTRESASIVKFLMSIDNPSQEIVHAIEKSVNWYKTNAIKNKTIKKSYKNYKTVLELEDCKNCDLIWARLYDLDKKVPIFSDRSEEIKYDISKVSHERMFSYEWYVYSGNDVLNEYKIWKKKYRK